MTIEEAIKILEDGEWWNGCDIPCDTETHRIFHEAMELAIAALRAQQEAEKNEPLTLDEVENELDYNKDGWLWCVDLSGEGAHGWRKNENLYKYANITNYGKTWLAYRHPPVGER